MMSLNLTALLLNRPGDQRLVQTGVIVISDVTSRCIFLGDNPLSKRLKEDFERYGEYYILGERDEKKSVFWFPNKISSFVPAASGYYAFGDLNLYTHSLTFDPKLDNPIFITREFQLTESEGMEKIMLQKVM